MIYITRCQWQFVHAENALPPDARVTRYCAFLRSNQPDVQPCRDRHIFKNKDRTLFISESIQVDVPMTDAARSRDSISLETGCPSKEGFFASWALVR